jgi:hypothetical protein
MMIPDVDRSTIREAIKFFDEEVRISSEWDDWEQHPGYAYAVNYSGRRYPARLILSLATHTPTSELSEGRHFVRYYQERGFQLALLGQKGLCSGVSVNSTGRTIPSQMSPLFPGQILGLFGQPA